MCCALNTHNALQNSSYGLLVSEMQSKETQEKMAVPISIGKKEGLRLTLDLHSNHASFGTITEDFNAFSIFMGSPAEFPVLRERSLQLEPGQEHSLELSAQVM